MSVGQQIDKPTIDATVASFAKQLTALFSQVGTFAAHLDATVDATLTALGYSTADIALLRSAYRDLNKLALVWQGLDYVAAGATANSGVPTANDATHFGYDFRSFTKQIDGVGF